MPLIGTPVMIMTNRPAALLRNGFSIFPCKGKVPMTKHGVKDASNDLTVVMDWLNRLHPTHWAVACGEPSGIVVVDVDVKEQPLLTTMRELFELGIPDNNVVSTPSGGLHLYCQYMPGLSNKVRLLGKPVDIRTDGGYVIACGPGYNLLKWDGHLADVPNWVVTACKPKPITYVSTGEPCSNPLIMAECMRKVGEGGRNHQLFQLACWCLRENGDLTALAQAASEQGLPNWEIKRTINSARRAQS